MILLSTTNDPSPTTSRSISASWVAPSKCTATTNHRGRDRPAEAGAHVISPGPAPQEPHLRELIERLAGKFPISAYASGIKHWRLRLVARSFAAETLPWQDHQSNTTAKYFPQVA